MNVSVYTPGQSGSAALEGLFVAREPVAKRVVDGVKNSLTGQGKHHHLLIGPRGSGKTHLIAIIHHRLSVDALLTERLMIAWLKEDPYISSYNNLLLQILQCLDNHPGQGELADSLETLLDLGSEKEQSDFAEQLLCQAVGKHTLLLIAENLDDLLAGIGKTGQQKFRALIQNHPVFCIVGSATTFAAAVSDPNLPFYGFFETQALTPFKPTDAIEMLIKLAHADNHWALVDVLKSPTGRARILALHYLAGGNPRIYRIFYDGLSADALLDFVAPLMRLIDFLTPDYQSQMRCLAPLQRTIVDVLCKMRGAISVKAIARQVMRSPSAISKQIGELEKAGYLQRVYSNGRNNFYQLREPLMRLCLEVKARRSGDIALFAEFLKICHSPREQVDPDKAMVAQDGSNLSFQTAGQWTRQGLLLFDQGRFAAALDACLNGLLSDCRYVPACQGMTILLRRLGWPHQLLEFTQQLAAKKMSLAVDQLHLGDCLNAVGRTDKAILAYQTAMDQSRQDRSGLLDGDVSLPTATAGKAMVGLANCFDLLGLHQKALTLLQQKENRQYQDPDDVLRRELLLVNSLLCLDRWPEGVKKLETTLQDMSATQCRYCGDSLLNNLLLRSQNPMVWQRFIVTLMTVFTQAQRLPWLGLLLVNSLICYGRPLVGNEVASSWNDCWQKLAAGIGELALPLRLLAMGTEFKCRKDGKALLKLSQEERGLLTPWFINLLSEVDDDIENPAKAEMQHKLGDFFTRIDAASC